MKAYVGHVIAGSGLLLGGISDYSTSPFEMFDDALKLANDCIIANSHAGRHAVLNGVLEIDVDESLVIKSDEILDGRNHD